MRYSWPCVKRSGLSSRPSTTSVRHREPPTAYSPLMYSTTCQVHSAKATAHLDIGQRMPHCNLLADIVCQSQPRVMQTSTAIQTQEGWTHDTNNASPQTSLADLHGRHTREDKTRHSTICPANDVQPRRRSTDDVLGQMPLSEDRLRLPCLEGQHLQRNATILEKLRVVSAMPMFRPFPFAQNERHVVS